MIEKLHPLIRSYRKGPMLKFNGFHKNKGQLTKTSTYLIQEPELNGHNCLAPTTVERTTIAAILWHLTAIRKQLSPFIYVCMFV